MAHLGLEVLRRILAGEGGSREVDEAAEHIVGCDRCRALAGSLIADLRTQSPTLRREGSLQLIFDLVDREHQGGSSPWQPLWNGPSCDTYQAGVVKEIG